MKVILGKPAHAQILSAVALLLIIVFSCVVNQAQASLIFNIDRIDDTEAMVTGSGDLSGFTAPTAERILSFYDIFSTLPAVDETTPAQYKSTMSVGGGDITESWVTGSNTTPGGVPVIYMVGVGSNTTSPVAGELIWDVFLSHARFAPIGSTGPIYWGFNDSTAPGVNVGTWNMLETPVPEPATMLLLGAGLIGIAGLRKRFIKR